MEVKFINTGLTFATGKVQRKIKVGNDTEGVVLKSFILANGTIQASSSETYSNAASPFINISEADGGFELHDCVIPGSGFSIVAFYDANKDFISVKKATEAHTRAELEVISAEDIPANAVYIRYTAYWATKFPEAETTSFVSYFVK